MSGINKDVHVLKDRYSQEMSAIQSHQQTVSIILSYSGKNKALIDIIKTLKEKHLVVILISSLLDSTFDKYCDYHLLLCSKENSKSNKISTYSSHISAQYMMDVLFSVIYKKHYEQYFNDQMKVDHILNKKE